MKRKVFSYIIIVNFGGVISTQSKTGNFLVLPLPNKGGFAPFLRPSWLTVEGHAESHLDKAPLCKGRDAPFLRPS